MLRIRDGPSALPGLDRLIFAVETSFEATVTLRALLVTFLLLFLAVEKASVAIRNTEKTTSRP